MGAYCSCIKKKKQYDSDNILLPPPLIEFPKNKPIYHVSSYETLPRSPNSLTPDSSLRSSRTIEIVTPCEIDLYRHCMISNMYGTSPPRIIRTKPNAEFELYYT